MKKGTQQKPLYRVGVPIKIRKFEAPSGITESRIMYLLLDLKITSAKIKLCKLSKLAGFNSYYYPKYSYGRSS